MLLALTTSHRVQTFSFIRLNNVFKKDLGYEILISDRIKTSNVSSIRPVLYLPFFTEIGALCVAKCLETYINKPSSLRNAQEQRLFLAFHKPHKPVSSQTLSRWIKITLTRCGIDTTIFTAHSTRHASTSLAKLKGVNVDLIRSMAGWSESSQTFARFYDRPVMDRFSYAKTLLS